jgi:pyruvate decarboxylase
MKHLLPKLTDRLQQFNEVASKIQVPAFVREIPEEDSQVITHAWFWPRLSLFFKPKDVIVTETGELLEMLTQPSPEDWCDTGTSNFGIIDVTLPGGTMLLSQILWGSIGWSVGTLQSVAT